MPDIEHLTVGQLAARVVRDYENKTSVKVGLQSSVANVAASARVKIAVYRLLQESLANAFHHAKCENCRVLLAASEAYLTVEVMDDGPGFDPRTVMERSASRARPPLS